MVPADNTTATGTADGADVRFDTVDNGARPFDVPQLGFVTPLGDMFALAVGFISPFAPSPRRRCTPRKAPSGTP